MTRAQKRPSPKRPASSGRTNDLAALEKALGHRFVDRELLALALTHSSAGQHRLDDNQRLEFLGDRVLGLAIADILHRRFPHEEEGALAKRHAQLVRRDALVEVARAIGLGEHLRLADTGRRDPETRDAAGALSDGCEALIAALYLDGRSEERRVGKECRL